MKLSRDTDRLARDMAQRQKEGEPFTLFLGRRCARAAGVPDDAEMALQIFRDKVFGDLFPQMSTALAEQDWQDRDRLVQEFYDMLNTLSSGERFSILQSFHSDIPVPTFYQNLARLIKAGYFRYVVTTSIDTLLEQALNELGLWPDENYQVINLGTWDTEESLLPTVSDMLTIVKLHGDLARGQVIAPSDNVDVLEQVRHWVTSLLDGPLVMVGYEFESESINRWLLKTSGELWWVSPTAPDPNSIGPRAARTMHVILEESAEPEECFGQLALRLLRQPITKTLAKSLKDYVAEGTAHTLGGTSSRNLTRDVPLATPADVAQDDSAQVQIEYLKDQIRQSRARRARLEQAVAQGETSRQRYAQIDYERHRLAQLEDQLRQLDYAGQFSGTSPVVPELMDQIFNAVQSAGIDLRTLSFLQSQVSAVKEEYSRPEPNQHVVSALISAAVSLAERLGPQWVNPELVRALAAFAPSVVPRRLS